MPAFSAQYQFAASFTIFLVALAGVALVLLRGEPVTTSRTARVALGAGFFVLAMAAFLQGSLVDVSAGALAAVRGAGIVGLAIGSLGWRGSVVSRALLWAGTAGLALGVPFELHDPSSILGTTVSAAGALLLGAALLNASRRAIAARVAASAAGTLLLLVLVLSTALSSVLSTTVQGTVVGELDGRAAGESAAIEAQNKSLVGSATVVASLLVGLRSDLADPASPQVLTQVPNTGTPTGDQRAAITAELERARRDIFGSIAFSYVSEDQRLIAGTGLDGALLGKIVGSPVVAASLAGAPGAGGSSTSVIDGRAYNIGVTRIARRVPEGAQPFGAVVAVFVLDEAYLRDRSVNVGDGIALVSTTGPVAVVGEMPAPARLAEVANAVLAGAQRRDVVTDDRVAAARPVRVPGSDQPVLAVVVARSTEAIDDLRTNLFRTFFIIAFGGTVLALLLAALVGDRIGSGIRRLTVSAKAIQLGALGVRSGVRSEDEVGVLGATFDSMAASIEQQTDELQAAAARVEAIVAGMGEALLAIDDTGRVTEFNAAAEELLGLTAAEARGIHLDEVARLMTDDGADITPRLGNAEIDRWSETGELTTPGGNRVPVAVTAGALRGADGAVEGAVIVLRDLRGEREVERMKRHFLSRVGHELRTPLTPLIGYSQLLAGRELSPERAKPVYASILSSARRLERIVQMLEFFASLDAGRQILRPEPVDVKDALNTALAKWTAADDGRHRFVKRVGRATPNVLVDPQWLIRSVDELVDNAVKFSPAGGRIALTAGLTADAPGMVEIAVRDQGVGMSPEEVETAFAEWSQGDESDTRSYGGLGLGLAMVQRVAEQAGGRVTCVTAPGKGAIFSILLPAVVPAPPAPGERRARRAARDDELRAGRPPITR